MFKKIMTLFVLLAFSASNAQIVINELDTDSPSTNDKQFVEIFNCPRIPLMGQGELIWPEK